MMRSSLATVSVRTLSRRALFPLTAVLVVPCLLFALPCHGGPAATVTLRSEPRNLTDRDIDLLLTKYGLYDSRRNPGGEFPNRFVPARYGSDRVVFDQATGLVWQQSGSQQYMDWQSALGYVRQLNEERFADFTRWRLPSVAELASLLKPEKLNGRLHLDPAFDPHQAWCWSSDQRGKGFAYLVTFYHGMIDWKFECGLVFVRAVASSSEFEAKRGTPATAGAGRPSGKTYTNSIGMKFVLIPSGSFLMGSPEGEPGRGTDEVPRHRVALSRSFYLGVTEITQGQWRMIMAGNPSRFRGKDLPVENVSWDECQEFIRRLNEREKTTRYRLPSEAEWEYACRAGSDTRFCFGDDTGASLNRDDLRYYFGKQGGELSSYAWYGNVSDNQTHPVAQKKPNVWGLYDMHGNVAEWCADCYGFYQASYQVDPQGPLQGTVRVLRGGSYGFGTWSVRSARRDSQAPQGRSCHWGFRLALEAR